MTTESWLRYYIPLITQRAGDSPVFELGCGDGPDTSTLTGFGFKVTALDESTDQIARARKVCPIATYVCQDMRDPWPVSSRDKIGVVLASLSLHYFAWADTQLLVARIHSLLSKGGILLCRLNSVNDHNHGARGYPEISHHFYQVGPVTKRFFDRSDIDTLFADQWRALSLKETTFDKVKKPKVAWECILEVV